MLCILIFLFCMCGAINIFQHVPDDIERQYGRFTEEMRVEMLEESKKMFYYGYNNYLNHAFPKDELNPILCEGRGPDYENPSNININDVLGDYSLTLIDSLDTLVVLRNWTEFRRAVQLVKSHVSFNTGNTIQVFEANIRIIGSLLSAHLLVEDSSLQLSWNNSWYDGELLAIAHDLASRLIPAFENTKTGLPYPRINLNTGVPSDCVNETCTAGAGSLLLEFGILSHLLGDPVYESVARRANKALWDLRSEATGLLGNVVDIQSGRWISRLSGLGAGMDSFFEYLLKSYILFGDVSDLHMFEKFYSVIKQYLRRGRRDCNAGVGDHPLYVNVDMSNGNTNTAWIDSLQAAFAGVQVLYGDLEEAICAHALFYAIWQRYGALPERFNWQRRQAEVLFYPLRPELIESTYLLYQATKNPFYLHVGRDILWSLNNHTRAACGYATIHNVLDKSLEDRMESFFLSETVKYLILLFDEKNHFNVYLSDYLFTTQGHIIPLKVLRNIRKSSGQDDLFKNFKEKLNTSDNIAQCHSVSEDQRWGLPLKSKYVAQLQADIMRGTD